MSISFDEFHNVQQRGILEILHVHGEQVITGADIGGGGLATRCHSTDFQREFFWFEKSKKNYLTRIPSSLGAPPERRNPQVAPPEIVTSYGMAFTFGLGSREQFFTFFISNRHTIEKRRPPHTRYRSTPERHGEDAHTFSTITTALTGL